MYDDRYLVWPNVTPCSTKYVQWENLLPILGKDTVAMVGPFEFEFIDSFSRLYPHVDLVDLFLESPPPPYY